MTLRLVGPVHRDVPMQAVQRALGGAEIGEVAIGFGEMERDAIDEAADQRLPAGP